LHAVAEDGFALVTIEIHSGWRKPTSDKHRIKYSTSYRKYGLHAFDIVGDDNNAGYWLVRNSWGTDWGDEGHAWLKYDDYHDNATDVWRAMAVEAQ
jgi:C1A family cysteine protease